MAPAMVCRCRLDGVPLPAAEHNVEKRQKRLAAFGAHHQQKAPAREARRRGAQHAAGAVVELRNGAVGMEGKQGGGREFVELGHALAQRFGLHQSGLRGGVGGLQLLVLRMQLFLVLLQLLYQLMRIGQHPTPRFAGAGSGRAGPVGRAGLGGVDGRRVGGMQHDGSKPVTGAT
ncbi:hypothetical protein ACFQT0_20995 [Hymenobacter humi]|uniref:Cation-transporting P-type ATPase N-terminal domain-containing protein n=1 Tax=Hymenobacter humi TaxID=1411620 RepID=A0ABW2UAU1_9BACT